MRTASVCVEACSGLGLTLLDVPVYLCICAFRSVRVQRSFEKHTPQLELFWSSVDVQRRPLGVWYNTT
jgi:hypothetical protein